MKTLVAKKFGKTNLSLYFSLGWWSIGLDFEVWRYPDEHSNELIVFRHVLNIRLLAFCFVVSRHV
jgi:hypothetical protein